MASQRSGGTSPWVYVGCGCGGLVVVVVAVAIGLGVWGVNKAKEFGEAMEDPVVRTEKALEILGGERLPDGYEAVLALPIPYVMDMVFLSSVSDSDSGEGASRFRHSGGFIYFSAASFGEDDQELRDFFEGKRTDVEALRQQNIDVDVKERLGTGSFDNAGGRFLWAAHRGSVAAQHDPESTDGLVTMFLVDCGDDDRRRFGLLYGADPDPEAPADSAELSGTVVDPQQIEAFWEPLRPCH